jgi:hypothetical protein
MPAPGLIDISGRKDTGRIACGIAALVRVCVAKHRVAVRYARALADTHPSCTASMQTRAAHVCTVFVSVDKRLYHLRLSARHSVCEVASRRDARRRGDEPLGVLPVRDAGIRASVGPAGQRRLTNLHERNDQPAVTCVRTAAPDPGAVASMHKNHSRTRSCSLHPRLPGARTPHGASALEQSPLWRLESAAATASSNG